MASIGKMSIRGIRSFSPEREETIEFYSPLTMIVGANGCGKTSIIEALKYCCTGSLPPNAKNGHAFINDPTMTDSTEVKASIKLRFKNKRGQDAVVVRSLQVTRKKTKLEYKALEGVIRMTNEDGETVSLSHKCSELDKHIPELLGVSAAVMESVIFCHQEESSWPLGESAILKKKFDDIFESTRFAKALEVIMKTKKEYAVKAKDLKCELVELAAHLGTHQDETGRRAACVDKKERCEEELARIAAGLERLQDKTRAATEVLRRTEASSADLRQAEWELKTAEIRLDEKQAGVDQLLSDADDVLESQLADFERLMSTKADALRVLQGNADASTSQLNAQRELKNRLNSQHGEARSIQTHLEDVRARHQELSSGLAKKLAVQTPVNSWERAKSRDFKDLLVARNNHMQTDGRNAVAAARAVVSEQERALLAAKEAHQRNVLEEASLEKDVSRVAAERDSSRSELGRLHGTKEQLRHQEEIVEEARTAVAEASGVDLKKLQSEVADASSRLRDLNERLSADQECLRGMAKHKEESDRLRLAVQQAEADMKAYLSEAETLVERHQDVFSAMGVLAAPDSHASVVSTHSAVDVHLKSHREALAVHRVELKTRADELGRIAIEKGKVAALTLADAQSNKKKLEARTLLNQFVPELNTIASKFKGKECNDLDATQPIRDLLPAILIMVDAGRNTVASIGTFKYMFDQLEKARENSNNACPCCMRSMEAKELAAYTAQAKKLCREKYFSDEDEYKKLSDRAVDIVETIKGLRDVLEASEADGGAVTKHEEEERRLDVLAATTRESHDRQSIAVKAAEDREKLLERLSIELSTLSRHLGDIVSRSGDLTSRLARSSQGVGRDLDGRTYADVEAAVVAATEQRDALQLRKDRLQADESKAMKRQFASKSNLADEEKILAEVKAKAERQVALQTRSAELETQFKDLSAEKAAKRTRTAALQSDVQTTGSAFSEAKDGLERLEKEWQTRQQESKADLDDLARVTAEVESVEAKAAGADLGAIEKALGRATESIAVLEENVRRCTADAAQLTQDLGHEDLHRKLIQDNLDLRRTEREVDALRAAVKGIQDRRGPDARAAEEATREMARANQERTRHTTEEATLKGRLEEVDAQIRDVDAKLNNATYRNIGERHRRKNIEFETTLMAVSDLDAYYNALDGALAQYHMMKIREINKIIRELWQQVYRGDDIDRIEISSDQDVDTSGGTAKRSYNYRVVMTKGTIPLDMRGRCSAGQRVLAAIVIRLALAETFCLTCGMFALDEPTTNLDDHNRSGLAHALARIISNRSKQQNFQLVCITHDETFVRLLSNELSQVTSFSLPEYYFRVSRREDDAGSGKYFSCIERIDWDDM